MRFFMSSLAFLLISLIGVQGVWSAPPENEEKVYAVQNRIFHRNHEINLYGAYLSGDDFYHSYPLGLGYTYHFNNHYSWEVVRAQYMLNMEKDLKSNLEENFGVTPEYFPESQFMYHTHLVFKPLYGKNALLNRWIANNEIYFFGGPGMIHYQWQYSTGDSRTEAAFSLSLGGGIRYFLSKRFCLNVEIRDLVNFREDALQNNLYFGVGFGYRFNFSPRKVEEDPTAKRLKKILDEDE